VLLDEYLKLEQDDAIEIIEWTAAQPWCDGNVGIIGIFRNDGHVERRPVVYDQAAGSVKNQSPGGRNAAKTDAIVL